MIRCTAVTAATVLALTSAAPARAGIVLNLSDVSSDTTSASILTARMDFALTGSILTLTVTNDTDDPHAFDLDALYFNATAAVTDLAPVGDVAGWQFAREISADGFGTFDFALLSASGNDPAEIAPQQSQTFTFDVASSTAFSENDFTTAFSRVPPGAQPALAAIKFVNGPGDDSAFGAVIPEPATLALVLPGLALVARRTRRRHSTA